MKDEIRRVMQLVQDGVLTPEDAADLIDAMQGPATAEAGPEPTADAKSSTEEQQASASGESGEEVKDALKNIVDVIENLGKDISQAVNWPDVSSKLREGATKGLDQLKLGVDKLKEGKFNFDLFSAHELRTLELPLNVPSGRVVQVENPCGDVKISGGDNPVVRAKARVRGSDQEDARKRASEYTVFVEESDHRVAIRQPDMGGIQVDLDIVVPIGTTVDVRTTSGDLTIHATKGACKVQAASGDITLNQLEGAVDVISQSGNVIVSDITTPSLTIENRSGDIAVDRVHGNINIRAASGDLRLTEISGKTISVETVSGDVSMQLREPIHGNVSLRTVNGSSSLTIPDGNNCRVSLSTLRGMVTCGIELEDEARSDQHVTGRLGDGSGSLDVSAVNGNIHTGLIAHTVN